MLTFLALSAINTPALASSHREAPLIANDPQADITDLHAFIDPTNSARLILAMSVNPGSQPGSGPNYYTFDDKAQYTFHIDNEGDGAQDVVYNVTFTNTPYTAPGSFLYNFGDVASTSNLNRYQTYSITRITDGLAENIATGIPVAPTNVGVKSAAAGEYNPESHTPGTITSTYAKTLPTGPGRGTKIFAGPRQDPFWIDLEATFDLLNNFAVTPTNTQLGLNVSSIVLGIPMTDITRDHMAPSASLQNEVISIWATVQRTTARVIVGDGTYNSLGPWKQVERLGNPLVNEAVIGVGDKDKFNATSVCGYPSAGACDSVFLDYVINPTLIDYMTALLGVPTPTDADCNAGLGIGGREDLVLAFLTGHPALGTLPGGFALGGPIPGEPGKTFNAFEALRINLAGTGFGQWPDGRGLEDEVVDVALSAEAGLLCTSGGSGYIDDGVGTDGMWFLNVFPFLGDPWAGDDHPVPLR